MFSSLLLRCCRSSTTWGALAIAWVACFVKMRVLRVRVSHQQEGKRCDKRANTYLVFTSLGSDDIRSSHRFVRWIPLGICCPQRAILLLYTLSRYLIDATPKDRPRTNFCRSRTFLFMPPRLYMPSLYCPFLRPHSILEQYHNQY
jgi:hypothetical protein